MANIGFSITTSEFSKFRDLLYDESGITLADHKKSLIVTRLSKRLRHFGFDNFGAYYDYVVSKGMKDGEFVNMLDLLSTNKTNFFREPTHFDFMADEIVPLHEKHKKMRIWSSACSSGEEPYTIGMKLHETIPDIERWDIKILASDLSTRVLDQAKSGLYKNESLSEFSPSMKQRHFLKGKGKNEGFVKTKSHLSDMVIFRRINLMAEDYPIKNQLDLIFCRNVMIYFDRPTQERLIKNFYRYLKPGGFLFIGHSESLHWLDSMFDLVQATVYRKEGY